MNVLKGFLRWLLRLLYRVEVSGLTHFEEAGDRVLVVANHTSFLDALLLAVFLPGRLTFAVNTHIARRPWLRPFGALARLFPMDPTSPLSLKSLIKYLQADNKAVIFPEGRITVTGSLMKIYQGPGLVADRSAAMLVPVRIDGAQYSPFSRLRGRVRIRWFPPIRLTVLPARRINLPEDLHGRARRGAAGQALADVMTEMMFATCNHRRTLTQAFLDARAVHGGGHVVAEDIERRPVTYSGLLRRSLAIAPYLVRDTATGERIGVLLPNLVNTVAVFLALQIQGRVPAMLNYTVGARSMRSAVRTASLGRIITSRRFVEAAKLEAVVAELAEHARVVYLEDVRGHLGPWDMLRAGLTSLLGGAGSAARRVAPDDPAVVLFTSGSEGTPKGVVLSHANLLSNRDQLAARVDFHPQDIILNALPMFHSFGLTAGTLLPLMSGMKVFFYPSPLHYRIVPEMVYDTNATILFGTNTFLAGYARFAHPYDFYSIRYVFAGAEKLKEETRAQWADKFGVRIFEGYGATETSPVLATNIPMAYRPGSVGVLLPGIDHRLVPVPGIAQGGRLLVRGPNVMLGYLLHDRPGELVPPSAEAGAGWYDTGDIVRIDEDGFVWIQGRAKRFAKVGGEMVSLTSVEDLAARTWPGAQHAAVSLPDAQKGEQIVLVTNVAGARRAALLQQAKVEGIGELNVPRHVFAVREIPLLGTGKSDYPAVSGLARSLLAN